VAVGPDLRIEEDARALLQEIVSIPSVNPAFGSDGDPAENLGEGRLAAYIRDLIASWGIDVETREVLPGRPNVVAHVSGKRAKGPKKRLLLESHMDTVQTGGMSIEPFAAVFRQGKVYGRGSTDAKGSLAAMLIALRLLTHPGNRSEADVYFAAVVDEEYRYRGVVDLIERGFQADGGVVGEPTGLKIVRACKGCVRWETVVYGKAAHSSRPEAGQNAIEIASELISTLRRSQVKLTARRVHPLIGEPTLVATLIKGGSGPNTVPDTCVITYDRRLNPGETPEQVLAEIRTDVERFAKRGGFRVDLRPPFVTDIPMEIGEFEPIVQAAMQAARSELGYYDVVGVTFGCDASKLTAAGIPTIVFGPGDIVQAHAVDEFVRVDEVAKAARFLVRLAGVI